MTPLITGEHAFRQHVCELIFGVNKIDMDLRVQVDPVKEPIKRNSVGPGYVSHRWTSAFGHHFDYRFIVFKNLQQGAKVRRFSVCDNVIHIEYFNSISVDVFLPLGVGVCPLGFVSPRVSPYWKVFGRMQCFNDQIPEIESGKYRPCEDQRPKK